MAISKWTSLLATIVILAYTTPGIAQGPDGKSFGFGIILGDPTGGTLKFWTTHDNAFDIYVGEDYFGGPRVGFDYLWHFYPFATPIANLYAGAGATFGFGTGGRWWYYTGNGWYYRSGGDPGVGVRALFGVNVIPERTPMEIFLEMGPLIGIVPGFGSAFDAALGIRFYP